MTRRRTAGCCLCSPTCWRPWWMPRSRGSRHGSHRWASLLSGFGWGLGRAWGPCSMHAAPGRRGRARAQQQWRGSSSDATAPQRAQRAARAAACMHHAGRARVVPAAGYLAAGAVRVPASCRAAVGQQLPPASSRLACVGAGLGACGPTAADSRVRGAGCCWGGTPVISTRVCTPSPASAPMHHCRVAVLARTQTPRGRPARAPCLP
jgi:hypothetical protein